MARRSSCLAVVLATVAALLSAGPVPAAHAASSSRTVDGRVSDWRGATSGFGGTSQYSRGEFVYQDHLFDDLGADTNRRAQQHGTTGAPKGDYRYPTDEKRYGYNAADLLELRIAADRDWLWVLARMNTLKVSDRTVVAIALDTDRSSSTGGGAWPHAAGLAVDGADRVITLWGTKGTVTKLPGGSPVPIGDVAVDTSNDNNAIEARIPRSSIGGASTVRVWAAAGLWDPAASEWMAAANLDPSATAPGGGSPLVSSRAFNVAFRDNEEGSFMEEHQAAALAAGDIGAFHADVDLGALSAGRSRSYRVQAGRFYAAVMDQKLTIPPYHEGLSYEGIPGRFEGAAGAALSQHFDYYGRHQPYGLYIPSTYGRSKSVPAALVLHGLGGSHSTYNSQPGFIADMGEGDGSAKQPPMFLVTPLARGSSFYADWGEADTLLVLRDALERFSIDSRRLYLTGYSMGGYGVYRLGSLYPDLFAAAASWAGYTGEFAGVYATDPSTVAGDPTGESETVGDGVRGVITPLGIGGGRQGKANIGDPVDTLENFHSLPLIHLAGSNDEIVPTTGQYAAPRRLAELGYQSRFDLYPGYEHFSFALVDDWKQARAWLGNRTRETAPRTVAYRFSDGWTAPGLARELGLVHGNAWWVRDLAMRKTTDDALELASLTATSGAIPEPTHTAKRSTAPSSAPTPHIQQLVSWDEGQPSRIGNRVDLELDGVGSVRIDMAGAGLKACGLTVGVQTDGPATVRLTGSLPSKMKLTGHGITAQATPGALTLSVPKAVDDGTLAVACRR